MTLYAKFDNAAGGYYYDKQIAKSLVHGKVYVVDYIDMGQSSTRVFLEGVEKGLNSINLNFYSDEKCQIEHDIYEDPEYNPYL